MRQYPKCNCFNQYRREEWTDFSFHANVQDEECDAWKRLLDLIEDAAVDGREEFAPLEQMTLEEKSQIVTLPRTISKLKQVKRLRLDWSFLVRIPPEIADMTSLEDFDVYHSYTLHWYPFEITHCKNLKDSRMSTRSLYGNYKFRPPFPKLQSRINMTEKLDLNNLSSEIWGASSITNCSVCNRSLEDTGLFQRWISLKVATDVMPLLVNACSEDCITKLPTPAENYVQQPHMGGLSLE